jgi:hypothetical protein
MTVVVTRANGKIIKCMDKAPSFGLMVENIQVLT